MRAQMNSRCSVFGKIRIWRVISALKDQALLKIFRGIHIEFVSANIIKQPDTKIGSTMIDRKNRARQFIKSSKQYIVFGMLESSQGNCFYHYLLELKPSTLFFVCEI
jgi:hypothetical protein